MIKYLVLFVMGISSYAFGQAEHSAPIDSILQRAIKSSIGPGVTVGVVKENKIIYQNSFGLMNLEYDIPFNDSTVIGLASVTKQFTSACIGVLENQKLLSVNDDIRRYIPELTFYGDTIRIKHLLNHTSGIRNHNVLLNLMGFDYAHQGYTNKTIEQLMFRQNGVNNSPGEKMLYSNTNYVLLALLVERVSGMKIHEFAQKELFMPLGMSNTFYKSDLNKVIKNKSYTYYNSGGFYKQPHSASLCVGAGGIKTTVGDLAKWSQIFLNPTHTFSYLSKFITQTDTLNNGEAMKHARGMFISPYKGYTTYNHSGRDLGMRSQFICLPDLGLTVIVYTNTNEINAVDISYEILNLFLQEKTKTKKEINNYTPKKEELKQFTGIYQELNSDLKLNVFIENDTLKAKSSLGREGAALESSSPNRFYRKENPSVKYIFTIKNNSSINLQVDFGGAIFYLEKIDLTSTPNKNLEEYVGTYYAEELDVTYYISIKKGQLTLDYPNNNGISLNEGQSDIFGSNRRTKYSFYRNKKGEVTTFKVASEGTVNNILFKKTSN